MGGCKEEIRWREENPSAVSITWLGGGDWVARLRGYRWTLEGLLLKAKIRRRWWSVCSFKAGRVQRCCLDLLWLYYAFFFFKATSGHVVVLEIGLDLEATF